jgi:hypothetical protein
VQPPSMLPSNVSQSSMSSLRGIGVLRLLQMQCKRCSRQQPSPAVVLYQTTIRVHPLAGGAVKRPQVTYT